jgi:hypothetical protein
VSAATAAAFWPGADPIGQTIRIERAEGRPVDDLPGYAAVTIVGTVADVVSGLMVDGVDAGHIYLPITANDPHAEALLLRPSSTRALPPDALAQIFARTGTDPESFETLPLEEARALQMYPLLAASWTGTLLAGIALALSVSGLYGVLTYTLAQRTREIGIRIALGATATAVIRLVLRQVARLAGWGAAIGLVAALGALGALSAAIRLQQISVLDHIAFEGGLLLVLAATALATYHPARRAARVDPVETLRAEG